MKKLSIIIPAYNEAQTVRELIERIVAVAYPIAYEVVVIDDHSTDQTYDIVDRLKQERADVHMQLLRNEINRGKGASLQKGLEIATGDVVIFQDADFEYDPNDIPKLLEPILKGETRVVYGSRFLGVSRPAGMAFPNYIANKFLTGLTNVLYGARLTDMETCYKVISMEIMRGIQLDANRFDFEPEISTKLIKEGIQILEMPISYEGRTTSEGKKIGPRDFFAALKVLFRNIWI